MERLKLTSTIFLIIITFSCSNTVSRIDSGTYAEFQKKGDEITNLSQATLLGNVGKAIQIGGTEYAVEFCNLKASLIVDSLNAINKCTITRVSEKNRNPENFLKNEVEKQLIQKMKTGITTDTLIRSGNIITYYKPITTTLSACLRCHGHPGSDITPPTLEKIKTLYPNDLATGYNLNDFRGMWKVEFNLN